MKRAARKRVVFVGGPPIRALARFYRAQLGADTETQIVVGGPTIVSRVRLDAADTLVMEVDEAGSPIPAADIPKRAERLRLPALVADFLWPYAGRPHPQNRGPFPIPGGPYPADHGDRFLDRIMEEGMGADEAIRRYLALDIASAANLDRKLEERLAVITRLDRLFETRVAPVMEAEFRAKRLFAARTRPMPSLLAPLAVRMCELLGLEEPGEAALRLIESPASFQPLHPGVIAHFGLTFATPEDRYAVNDEGEFTFEEQCRRYLSFAWNERLQRGFKKFKTDPKTAVGDLKAGLASSPGSLRGKRALEAARQAAGLAPAPEEKPAPDTATVSPAAAPEAPARAPAAARAPRQETAPAPRPAMTPVPEAPITAPPELTSQAVPALPEAAEEDEPSLEILADAALRPPLPFSLPAEPAAAAPKKKPSLFQRLLGRS